MKAIEDLKAKLALEFEVDDMDPAKYFLGVRITRDWSKGTISLCEDAYILKILDKFVMSKACLVDSPMNCGIANARSKRQDCVTLFTTEAEYVAATMASQEATWFRYILKDLGYIDKSVQSPLLLVDNQDEIKDGLTKPLPPAKHKILFNNFASSLST
ncbi:hypothetical protein AXG93_857s1030 [Marchantia polymorpha subsp. ruderalis]|uniref:Reverse transcriptase Ty1/copia-type domain-containing protein n=1 Tax=Marchantia polymorpha subsp. ruderalis TaxID=1480154 RepID=A0A176WEM1_MARPO|nr:hypothetical protein AXG93_857s1030 [Marchantia polymorpha subsp. ruderalis]